MLIQDLPVMPNPFLAFKERGNTIRCKYCLGTGQDCTKSQTHKKYINGKGDYRLADGTWAFEHGYFVSCCPNCDGTGNSRDPYDFERNGTAVGVKVPGDPYDVRGVTKDQLRVLIEKDSPNLKEIMVHSLGYVGKTDNHMVGISITWKNRVFDSRLKLDHEGQLYPKGYWE